METWYKANLSFLNIEEILVSKETSQFVIIAANRAKWKKETEYYSFFKTKEEAKKYLIKYLNSRIDPDNQAINKVLNKKIEKIKQL